MLRSSTVFEVNSPAATETPSHSSRPDGSTSLPVGFHRFPIEVFLHAGHRVGGGSNRHQLRLIMMLVQKLRPWLSGMLCNLLLTAGIAERKIALLVATSRLHYARHQHR